MALAPDGELVFDTTCGLHFAAAGHDHLLEERYVDRSYFSNEAVAEIERGEAAHGHNCARLLRATWWRELRITEPDDIALFNELLGRWGRADRNRGEAAAHVLARRLDCWAIVDDRQGRAAAKEFGVRHTGTIGLLAHIVVDGRLTLGEGWAVHEDFVALGFRSMLKTEADFTAIIGRLRGV